VKFLFAIFTTRLFFCLSETLMFFGHMSRIGFKVGYNSCRARGGWMFSEKKSAVVY